MLSAIARAPGKLVVVGEFAVLEPGHAAVVAAVDRHVVATVRPARQRSVMLGGATATWREAREGVEILSDHPAFRVVESALSTALRRLSAEGRQPGSFALDIRNEMRDASGRKYGLGSSAAMCVAVVAALLGASREAPADRQEVFRLAAIAHHGAQGGGSGVDIAASVFGGWLLYRSYGPAWLARQIGRGRSIAELSSCEWPALRREELPAPPIALRIGWTGEPSDTKERLGALRARLQRHPQAKARFLAQMDAAVQGMTLALRSGATGDLIRSMQRGRSALWSLASECAFPVESVTLSALADAAEALGGGGKSSGAGGGDCGIAFVPAGRWTQLRRDWRDAGATPLAFRTGASGVQVEVATNAGAQVRQRGTQHAAQCHLKLG